MADAVGPTSRKRGIFADVDEPTKRLCTTNAEYTAAFRRFDTNGNGNIEIGELNAALQAVRQTVETRAFPNPFNPTTVVWLAARFSANALIGFQQFAEMMTYLEGLKRIFAEIDVDRTGDISVSELSRALYLSGFFVTGLSGGGDPLSLVVAERIGRPYDADANGVLTFDEFVQLRLEWDCYLDAWAAHVPPGTNTISPAELLSVLDAVKRSLEPVGVLALDPALGTLSGFSATALLAALLHSSMFKVHRPFQHKTAELLIARFSGGGTMLTFEQFCMLMDFLREQKSKFAQADVNKTGSIDIQELSAAFAASGLPMPLESLVVLGQRYDQDNSGVLEFDEFLQMMAELKAKLEH